MKTLFALLFLFTLTNYHVVYRNDLRELTVLKTNDSNKVDSIYNSCFGDSINIEIKLNELLSDNKPPYVEIESGKTYFYCEIKNNKYRKIKLKRRQL